MNSENRKQTLVIIDNLSKLIQQAQNSISIFKSTPITSKNINRLLTKIGLYFETLNLIPDLLYHVMEYAELREKINLLYKNAHDFVIDNINIFNVANDKGKLAKQAKTDASNIPGTSSSVLPLTVENLNKLRDQTRATIPYVEKLSIINDWVIKINEEVNKEIPHEMPSNSSKPSSSTSTNTSGRDSSLYRSSERLNNPTLKGHFMVDPKELNDKLIKLSKELNFSK